MVKWALFWVSSLVGRGSPLSGLCGNSLNFFYFKTSWYLPVVQCCLAREMRLPISLQMKGKDLHEVLNRHNHSRFPHLQPCLVSLDLHHISGWCIERPSVPPSNHLKQHWVKKLWSKCHIAFVELIWQCLHISRDNGQMSMESVLS